MRTMGYKHLRTFCVAIALFGFPLICESRQYCYVSNDAGYLCEYRRPTSIPDPNIHVLGIAYGVVFGIGLVVSFFVFIFCKIRQGRSNNSGATYRNFLNVGYVPAEQRLVVPSQSGIMQTTSPQGTVITNSGRPIPSQLQGTVMINSGQPILPQGTVITNAGQPIPQQGNVITNAGQPIPQQGTVITNAGQPIPQQGTVITNAGQPIPQQGTVITNAGQPIPQQGTGINSGLPTGNHPLQTQMQGQAQSGHFAYGADGTAQTSQPATQLEQMEKQDQPPPYSQPI